MKYYLIILILFVAVCFSTSVHAAEEGRLRHDEIRKMRESGDREGFRDRIISARKERSEKKELTIDQQNIISELKKTGSRKEIGDQLREWGIGKPSSKKPEPDSSESSRKNNKTEYDRENKVKEGRKKSFFDRVKKFFSW